MFDFSDLDDVLEAAGTSTLPVAKSPQQPGFNRFDPDFVYRYKKVGALSVAQLEEAAVVITRRLVSAS